MSALDIQNPHPPFELELLTALEEAVFRADLQTARRLVIQLGDAHGYDRLMFAGIEPILRTVGERVRRQEASLAQSYVASMIADEVLKRYESSARAHGDKPMIPKGPVVLGNIEDDCHPLGRKIVSSFLRVHGWDVRDLGIDVEAKTLVDHAVEVGARVIGVSAMLNMTAKNILKVRQEINARGLEARTKLAVGGAVFQLRPELVRQVGGDGTAPNGFEAVALFEKLWHQAEPQGPI